MDMLAIHSKLMRGIISKFLTKYLSKKLGYNVAIELEDLVVTQNPLEKKAQFEIKMKGEMNSDDLSKVIKKFV